ncbi:MAG TPA: GNAT family protein [Bacteroidales bacterium]|jgi:RimJ/RimL family protein N-acetyltransferase|nr:GNAT family protein [Bacteroidales bacterium]HRS18839.1 GNAT family protein [Bacteroidales bacterium]
MNIVYCSIDSVDDDSLFCLFSDNELLVYTDVPIIRSIEQNAEIRNYYTFPRIIFFIKISQYIVGFVSAYCNIKHKTACITCVLQPQFQKQGIMHTTLVWFHNYLVVNYSIVRIEAQVYTEHSDSIAMLESLGYTREGCLRKNFMIQGTLCDSYMYSLLCDN